MERAHEEIQRLNIEIKRVVTHMQDEEAFLSTKEMEIRRKDAVLAFHIKHYREERTRFYEIHRRRFKKLAQNPHFTGSIVPGIPCDKSLLMQGLETSMNIDGWLPAILNDAADSDAEEVEDTEDTEKEIVNAIEALYIT
ncbi:hypothetical protein C0992_007135 [Termitomyces sp. T32_za158]|nr:hypothetical protein C0992_007135 [Termitomyces sp. T32_za158]